MPTVKNTTAPLYSEEEKTEEIKEVTENGDIVIEDNIEKDDADDDSSSASGGM